MKLFGSMEEIESFECGINFIRITDKVAELKIKNYIKHMKNRGIKRFDDFELMELFRLPIEQIDRVLDKMISEGVIDEEK